MGKGKGKGKRASGEDWGEGSGKNRGKGGSAPFTPPTRSAAAAPATPPKSSVEQVFTRAEVDYLLAGVRATADDIHQKEVDAILQHTAERTNEALRRTDSALALSAHWKQHCVELLGAASAHARELEAKQALLDEHAKEREALLTRLDEALSRQPTAKRQCMMRSQGTSYPLSRSAARRRRARATMARMYWAAPELYKQMKRELGDDRRPRLGHLAAQQAANSSWLAADFPQFGAQDDDVVDGMSEDGSAFTFRDSDMEDERHCLLCHADLEIDGSCPSCSRAASS